MIVDGHWRYHDYGILDRGHLRFFTKKEIGLLFERAGLWIMKMEENVDERYKEVKDPISGAISFDKFSLNRLAPDEARELFVTRYLITAKKAP